MFIGTQMALLKKAQQREIMLEKMNDLLNQCKTEKRKFSEEENKSFDKYEKEISKIDEELKANNTDLVDLMKRMDERNAKIEAIKNPENKQEKKVEARSKAALEIRGYRGKDRIGEGNQNVSIGDLIYSHITGKFKNAEVRAALSTTSGGLVIPQNVYSDFIDKLRDASFLGQVTTFPMESKTLAIPRVVSDIEPAFKLENELIPESNPVFDSVTLEARPLYALCPMSLELVEGSNLEMGSVITDLMASAMGAAMQNFMLHGAVNGYAGILNDPAINAIDAAAVDYAAIGAGVRAVRNNNGNPTGLVINSDDLMNLELLTDTTGQFITPPRFMNDLETFDVANAIDAGSALVGDLASIAFGVLSEGGLQIEVSRTAGEAFSRGQILVRARLNGDFVATNPRLLSLIAPAAL